MVVQIMKTVDTAGTPDVLPSPAKTLKLEEHSSPARSCEYKQESCEQVRRSARVKGLLSVGISCSSRRFKKSER